MNTAATRTIFWSLLAVLSLSGCSNEPLCPLPMNRGEQAVFQSAVLADPPPLGAAPGPLEARGEGVISEESRLQQLRARVAANLAASLAMQPSRRGPEGEGGRSKDGADILLLSGGGQLGAYGAGVLNGWTATGHRPRFEVVAGISTGALIATYAFLGTPADDAILRERYTDTENRDIFTPRSLLSLPWANSLADTTPLHRLLDKSITIDLLRRVAEEGRAGRQLWIGVVELKSGEFLPVNLTDIAIEGTEDARQLYVKMVLAAASIPAVFPPVCASPFVLVDGGTRQNVFLPAVIDGVADGARGAPVRVWVLMNNTLATGAQWDVRSNVLSIASRAIGLLFKEAQIGAVTRVYLTARQQGWQMGLTDIPLSTCGEAERNCPTSMVDQFCPEYMRCLFEYGFERAKQQNAFRPWRPS